MDLRAYYKKVREIESTLSEPYVVVVSVETPDGGKAGVLTEVARLTAARQIAEGRARAAAAKERDDFYVRNREAKQAADKAAAVSKMQFVVLPAPNAPIVSTE
jgi:sRNA-binding protein